MSKYIGYFYQYNDEGVRINHFTDWCESSSLKEAKSYLEYEYCQDPNIELDEVVEE